MGLIRIIVVLVVLSLICIVAPKLVDDVINAKPDVSNSESVHKPLSAGDSFDMTLGEWKQALSPELYKVARCGGTEAPFSGKYNDFFDEGKYYCYVCANLLFSSETKLKSKSGWPAFSAPASKDSVIECEEGGSVRFSLKCAKCQSHIGFLSTDDPEKKAEARYIVNSISLHFIPSKKTE